MNDSSSAFALETLTLYEAPQQKQERQSFEDWLKTAKGGQRFVYCTRHCLDAKTPPEVLQDAQLAKEAYERGEIELVQRRVENGGPFEYIALKKREVRAPRPGIHESPEPYRARDFIKL
jgi:hypothetical protein